MDLYCSFAVQTAVHLAGVDSGSAGRACVCALAAAGQIGRTNGRLESIDLLIEEDGHIESERESMPATLQRSQSPIMAEAGEENEHTLKRVAGPGELNHAGCRRDYWSGYFRHDRHGGGAVRGAGHCADRSSLPASDAFLPDCVMRSLHR